MGKLGVNNTAAIVMYAAKYRLVSPSEFNFSTSPFLKGSSITTHSD
jgi:hypothetical protein